MEQEINYFLNYDTLFINEISFYTKISSLGDATEETVEDALLISEEFLRRLTDVDSTFQSSRTICLRLAADVMTFVNRGIGVDPAETGNLTELREIMRRKFARLKGSWVNYHLRDHNDSECTVIDMVNVNQACIPEREVYGLPSSSKLVIGEEVEEITFRRCNNDKDTGTPEYPDRYLSAITRQRRKK